MSTAVLMTAIVLIAFSLLHFMFSWGFAKSLRKWKPSVPLPDEQCPKAVVILPLRGDDPTLRDCIEGLLSQDYPDYAIRVVIDHRDDPAWSVVEEVVKGRGAMACVDVRKSR